MATGRSLKLKFGTAFGEKTFSFPNSKITPSPQAVKNLAETMIANGSIYKYPPLELHNAYVEIVTQNVLDID